jgi:putative transposase
LAISSALFASVLASLRSRAALQIELIALRHQLCLLQRSVKRPRLTAADRFFWGWLSTRWSHWRTALVIVKPETVIGWQRKSFRLFWTWKVRRGDPGRPAAAKDVRDLIRKMSRENPIWGAPRIHGELLKLASTLARRVSFERRMNPPDHTDEIRARRATFADELSIWPTHSLRGH